MHDRFWNGSSIGCGAALLPWLHDHGSLTRRIQQRCREFRVRNIHDGPATAAHDETALLGVPARQRIYTREVLLLADRRPVVFAHSVVAAHHLRGAWQALQHLGDRSLGSLLFTHPLVRREPLHYRILRPSHALHRHAARALGSALPALWARRSLFTLHGAPLLVTEAFLPDILELPR
ncbi:MAG: chorismate lyase [Sideroxydans sp.]|nr:chorismate lyase [Sideroxydans sp.]